jgi:hypothetical protein
MGIALCFQFPFVMFHESQTWGPMAIEELLIIYFKYIDFIQSSSYNGSIKIKFDLKWTLSSKMLLCKFLSLLLVFRLPKGCHQDFTQHLNIGNLHFPHYRKRGKYQHTKNCQLPCFTKVSFHTICTITKQ